VTIPFSRYVRITSGVAASVAVATRNLIGRIFSTSALLSPDAVLEFVDAGAVGEYFGTSSDEYARALSYFSYQSPSFGVPKRLSFARYSPSGNGAQVYGATPVPLATLNLATAGSFDLTFNGTVSPVSGVDLSGAASNTAAAALIQTAIRAVPGSNTAAATVVYDAIAQRFVLSTNFVADVTVSVSVSGAGNNDLATALGWASADALLIAGTLAQTPSDAFLRAENLTNSFGAFTFSTALTISQHAELAALNAGRNVAYLYLAPVTAATAETTSAALIGFAGTGLTLSPVAGQFPEFLPAAIAAATDYGQRDAVVNYMFKQLGGLAPAVSSNEDADTYDALRVNYYGRTQTAGQFLDFYQRGLLCGSAGAPVDMNVYVNEMWLKDAVGAAIMALLLSTGRVPANASGRGQILAVVQDSINAALFNGTISVGDTLTAAQKAFITTRTGDPLAWNQVQTSGYWVDAQIVPYTGPGGTTEYKAVYTLIYAKDDAIRAVDGFHNLV